jgi:non-heme chloroperoxidase
VTPVEERLVAAPGAELFVRAAGPVGAPPVLLVHGFAQSADAWSGLMASPLAAQLRLVALDLRGHGRSSKPDDDGYGDPAAWAGDLGAVIAAFALERPVLVGWSYGGLVACDALRVLGADAFGACLFVGASTSINDDEGDEPLVGPAMLSAGRAMCSRDADKRAAGALELASSLRRDPRPAEIEAAVAVAEAVPVSVRRALLGRVASNADVLRALTLPTVVAHGSEDALVLEAMGRRTAALVPEAGFSRYEGIGHAPFAEAPERFTAELLHLTTRRRA